MHNIIIKDRALTDALDAYLYYEDKLDGLGDKFLKALHDRYDQLSISPENYSFIDKRKKLRDIKLRGFPYVIIYDNIGTEVTVYAIHNSHKNTKYIDQVKSDT